MKVSYIYHSGYLVETESATLLFDYYKGKLPAFPANKPLIVFASHRHKDHFDFQIFQLKDHPGGVYYVFGNDIRLSDNYLLRHGVDLSVKEKIHRMPAHTEWYLKLYGEDTAGRHATSLNIHTLKSTDAGVAFYVKIGRESIFHAGDLNWWHWEGETEAFNKQQEKIYKEEIQYLKTLLEREVNRKANDRKETASILDVAFIPLDPRLENAYCYGMDYFLLQIPVKEVYPMHMWEDYEVIVRYLKHCEAAAEKRKYGALIKKHTFFTEAT